MPEVGKAIEETSKEILKNVFENAKNINIDKRVGEIDNNISRNSKLENISIEKRTTEQKINPDVKFNEYQRMEPPTIIQFKCPEGIDKNEFIKQLKGQERGLNSQTIKENVENRETYQKRKIETGEGRLQESGFAQQREREKAEASRIKTNMQKGMSPNDAKKEANEWLKTQDALHYPDQIAGGNPLHVSKMGDRSVNRSIGAQWNSKVTELDKAIKEYSKGLSEDEISKIKLNFRLEMEE